MIISDEIRKYVAFVAMRMADDTLRLVGSGFFLGRDKEGDKVHRIRFRNGAIHCGRRVAPPNPQTFSLYCQPSLF